VFIGSSADALDAVALEMLVQFALQDIGQLTDLTVTMTVRAVTTGEVVTAVRYRCV
jgi:hypothetical protein